MCSTVAPVSLERDASSACLSAAPLLHADRADSGAAAQGEHALQICANTACRGMEQALPRR